MQNVVVLGGSYGGGRAVQILSQSLSRNYRVILIERNSHANHLYVIPRMAVIPGHEHKAFIPYKNIFNFNSDPSSKPLSTDHPHLVLNASVISISANFVTIDRTFPQLGFTSSKIPFAYAIYALGSHLPAPINLWAKESAAELQLEGRHVKEQMSEEEKVEEEKTEEYHGTKAEGVAWLKRCQKRIEKAESVLVVGGGALGIQFATDIRSYYPAKHVTLLHSRHRLLPRFDSAMHNEIIGAMEDLQVDLLLGERLDLESTKPENRKVNEQGQRVVKTLKGREVAADLILLCTGQTPNTDMLKQLSKDSVDPETKLAYVLPTMQLGVPNIAGSSVETISESLEKASLEPPETPVDEYSENTTPTSSATPSEFDLVEDEQVPEPDLEQTPFPNIFVVGDAADAFGAINAGHNAYFQAEVAARNVLLLTKAQSKDKSGKGAEEEEVRLIRYKPGPPGIKVSLGLNRHSVYEINGVIGKKDTPEPDDLDAGYIWTYFGMPCTSDEQMYE